MYQPTTSIFVRVDHEDCIVYGYSDGCSIPFNYQGLLAGSQGGYRTTFNPGGIQATAIASVNGFPHPQVAVSVDSSGYNPTIGDVGGDAYAALIYDFGVIGPDEVEIPVTFNVTETVGGDNAFIDMGWGSAFEYACMYLFQGQTPGNPYSGGYPTCSYDTPYNPGRSGGTYTFSLLEWIESNTPYQISLIASVESFDGLAFASADTTLSIDPLFAQNYSILFSPGIGNTVPEPSSLALVGISLIGLFAVRGTRVRGT